MRRGAVVPVVVVLVCLMLPLVAEAWAAPEARAYGGIAGKVTNAYGQGIADVEIVAVSLFGGSWSTFSAARTDASGVFSADGMPAGMYRIFYFDGSGAYVSVWYLNAPTLATARNVVVVDGATSSGLNVQLATAGRMSGKVTDAQGVPSVGMYVRIAIVGESGISEMYWPDAAAVPRTDASGQYDVGGLSGRYKVGFSPDLDSTPAVWYDNATSRSAADLVEVAPGSTTREVDGVVGPLLPAAAFTINDGAAYTNARDVTLSWGSLAALAMRFSEGAVMLPWTPFLSSVPFTVSSGDGEKVITGQYRSANNVGAPRGTAAITLDTKAPTTAVSGVPKTWTNKRVTLTLTGSDELSGLDYSESRVGDGAWKKGSQADVSGAGATTVAYRSVDRAGNREATQTCEVKIDTTKPVARAWSAQGQRGKKISVSYRVDDVTPFAKATLTLKLGSKVVSTTSVPRARTNQTQTQRLKLPSKPGKYTLAVTAADEAGNRTAKAGKATVTVK